MRTYLKILGGCLVMGSLAFIATRFQTPSVAPTGTPGWTMSASSVHIAEPFKANMLDKMERLQRSRLNREHKVQLAAILYRYGRSSGEEFLAKALIEERDITAATVFALNREEAWLPHVLESLKHWKIDKEAFAYSLDDEEFPLALGQWKHPRIAAALLAKQKANPHYGELAIALARQNVKKAVPLITRLVATTDDVGEINKFEVALARLTPENDELFHSLLSIRYPGDTSFRVDEAMWYLAYLQDPRLVPVLLDTIDKFEPPMVAGEPVRLAASHAVEPLAQYPPEVYYPTLRKVFDELALPADGRFFPPPTKMRVASHLYRARPNGDYAFLRESLGNERLEELKAMHKLKPIPEYLLDFDEVTANLF